MAQTKVKLIADDVIVQSNLNASHGITTADIGENASYLYYTDARVSSYLSTNGYATQTDIVAAITDSAPVTLDTLNELAAALGDDPNFATTTATSLGLKAPLASPSFTGVPSFSLNDGTFIKAVNATNNVASTNVWGYGLYEGGSKLAEISLVRDGSSNQMYIGTTTANQTLRIGTANKVTALTIDASQNSTFAGNITFGDSHFIGDDASDNLLIQSSAGENIIINSLDETLFRINGSTKMQIGSSGIMYIMGATASKNNSLQLQYNSTAGTAEIYSKSTGGNTSFEFYTSDGGVTSKKLSIANDGTSTLEGHLYLKAAANQGQLFFGTNNDYEIFGGGMWGYFGFASPTYYRFFSNGTDIARITTDGITLGDGSQRNITGPTNQSLGLFARPNSASEGIIFSTDGGTTTEMFIQDGGRVNIGPVNSDLPSALNIVPTNNYDPTGSGGRDTGGILIRGGTTGNQNNTGGIGFAFGTGTAGISGYQNGSDADRVGLKFFTHGSGTGSTASALSMIIKSGGEVGIGTTSPSEMLHVNKNATSRIVGAYFTNSQANTGAEAVSIAFGLNRSGGDFVRKVEAIEFGALQQWTGTPSTVNSYLAFNVTKSESLYERMRVTTNGIDVTSWGAHGVHLKPDTADTNNSGRLFLTRIGGSGWAVMNNSTNFSIRSGAQVDSTSGTEKIRLTGYSATSWTSGSDETIKENIKPIGNVLDKINDYRCVEYNLIDDETKDKKIGFIAQDWQEDFPQIIEQMENEKIGMKYTETIPILLKAIQELKAEIEILKNK